jgi:hypothetical protein
MFLAVANLEAVPAFAVVAWFKVGTSEATIALNTGNPFVALGAAKKYLLV